MWEGDALEAASLGAEVDEVAAVTLVGPGFAKVGDKYFRSASKKRRYIYLTNWAFAIYINQIAVDCETIMA